MPKTHIDDYDYVLPRELIAQQPLPQRDQSRMMVVERRSGRISHRNFYEFPDFFQDGDLLVLNNTRVIPARARGRINGRDIEFLFLKQLKPSLWEVLCRPARKVRKGKQIIFSTRVTAVVHTEGEAGKRVLQFDTPDILNELKNIGYAPLPPYIKRNTGREDQRSFDLDRYQTVFAEHDGSIAAPTAGLHFTDQVLARLKDKGVQTAAVTLNVGLATFQPVRVENIEKHRMLEENFHISPDTAARINTVHSRPEGKVAAVGTTSVRTLESSIENGKVRPGRQATDLFIYPGYRFQAVDALLTNFHLPRSTLLMLTSAFGGYDVIRRAYREAVNKQYRFFSYGDCMLIL